MNVWFDLKYACRLLRKSWGYSLMCASVVALSVGLAVWTYTLAYNQMLKPLPFAGSDRWYSVQIAPDGVGKARPAVDAFTWQQMIEQSRTADHLGAFTTRPVVLSEGEATTSLRGAAVTPRLLAATGAAPLLGRMFEAGEGETDAGRVAVLSFDTWQRYFAADRNIIGRNVRIDAGPVQIVGVMPEEFFFFEDFEVLMPLHVARLARPQDSTLMVSPVVLRAENQNLEAIANELRAAIASVNKSHPQLFNPARRLQLVPASKIYTHNVKPIIAMMSLIAMGVLLLGCVNISMVFLARLLERSRELALRTALGASRPRLLRQCLLETAVIVLLGLAAGYGLAFLGVEWTHGISDYGSRVLADGRSPNVPMLRPSDFIVALTAATAMWLLSTLIPAWRISRQDAAVVLAGSGKGSNVRGSSRTVRFLVGLQVVISSVVLVTCGNLVMAVKAEMSKPSGLKTERVMLSTYPTQFDARFAEPASRVRYWDDLSAAISAKLPGAAVAFTTASPTRPTRLAATIETRQGDANRGTLTLPLTVVSERYFDVMGVTLRSGRLFDANDKSGSLAVAVIDEKMAARFWPGEEVVGKRLRFNSSADGWLTIVGVVSAVRGAPYRADADLGSVYQPLRQVAPAAFQLVTRLPNLSSDNRDAIRAAAYGVDRDLPLHNLQLLEHYLIAINRGNTAMADVFLVIAFITALLAASGLFGLISRSVAQRTQEVGIRRALGATQWKATSMFMRQGALYLSVAVVGLTIGVIVTPLLSGAIPNIFDRVVPVTIGVVALMTFVISTASYLPTRRAVALEPGDALRYE